MSAQGENEHVRTNSLPTCDPALVRINDSYDTVEVCRCTSLDTIRIAFHLLHIHRKYAVRYYGYARCWGTATDLHDLFTIRAPVFLEVAWCLYK